MIQMATFPLRALT